MSQINGEVRAELEVLRSAIPADDERAAVIDALLNDVRPAKVEWTALAAYDDAADDCEPGEASGPGYVTGPSADLPHGKAVWRTIALNAVRTRVAVASRPLGWAAGVAGCMALANLVAGSVSHPAPRHARAVASAPAVGAPRSSRAAYSYADRLGSGLPNARLTPGEYRPDAQTVAPPRPVPTDLYAPVLAAYGLDPADNRFVVCRLVPAQLGGTDATSNLFPVNSWFANLKARLDRKLAGMVADRRLTIAAARKEIASNWLAAVHHYGVRNYGARDPARARQMELAMGRLND